MSSLRPGDEDLHYSDGSHRWIGPYPDATAQADWESLVRAHKDQHLMTMGRPVPPGYFWESWVPEDRPRRAPRRGRASD